MQHARSQRGSRRYAHCSWPGIVKRLSRFVGLCGCGLALAGCGQGSGSELAGRAGASGQALDLGSGVTVTSASYRITGPNGFSSAGTVAVGDSADVSVPVSGLPPGTGFQMDLAATASDGMTVCEGVSTFDVPASGTATVVVHLTCGIPSGEAQVTATTNICPAIDALQALPTEARLGGHMSLSVSAHDADNGPNALAYRWSANGRTLNGQVQSTLTFTCTSVGSVTIMVAVSDGTPCTDSATVTLTCSP